MMPSGIPVARMPRGKGPRTKKQVRARRKALARENEPTKKFRQLTRGE